MDSISKTDRILRIYTKLLGGEFINKKQESQFYGVDERSIQRDIDDIRNFLESDSYSSGATSTIVYDHRKRGYRLNNTNRLNLSHSEILAVCKILLDSRAFRKNDMKDILNKLVTCCVPKPSQNIVKELIQNEEFHYVEPRHQTYFIDTMWKIGLAIRSKKYIEIDYLRMKDKLIVKRKLKPVGIMFSEYYFYLTAFIDNDEVRKDFDVINDSFPTIYRIDRIKNLVTLNEYFHIPYGSRFEEGEFRKRIQFMYGGKLQKVQFTYSGNDIDSVLDKLPTAKIISEENEVYTLTAEVFGKGIDMWFRSQGRYINNVVYY